ncbi:hypothetical protein H0H87_011558 [Tephrocybe sp. NHM501043]|nr:hypothetical protein H0H87_011558 [Tephrocybe sp. NHM501043]
MPFESMYSDAHDTMKDLRAASPPQPQAHPVIHSFEQLRGKGSRVVALLDGDGAIFSTDLIAQGRVGGHIAAQKLSDSVLQYLSSNFGANQYQLWVYVFLNKRGLVDTFSRIGNLMAKMRFDDFMIGFNQAAERFVMVDVGDAKEAADAKIKARLEDELRLPQTCKIIFGGCHDNGYVTNLRSQITAGFKQKLILLRSYTEMAAGIVDFELPVLTIPDLFLERKIIIPAQVVLTAQAAPAKSSPRAGSSEGSTTLPTPQTLPEFDQNSGAPDAAPEPTVESDALPQRRLSFPPSYSSAVQRRVPIPDLDSSGSTTSEASDDLPERPIPTSRGSRHVNPNIESFVFGVTIAAMDITALCRPNATSSNRDAANLWEVSALMTGSDEEWLIEAVDHS